METYIVELFYPEAIEKLKCGIYKYYMDLIFIESINNNKVRVATAIGETRLYKIMKSIGITPED